MRHGFALRGLFFRFFFVLFLGLTFFHCDEDSDLFLVSNVPDGFSIVDQESNPVTIFSAGSVLTLTEGDTLILSFTANRDLNFSDVTLGVSEDKAWVHFASSSDKNGIIGDVTFYVPGVEGSSQVIICPDATSLEEVSESCEGAITLTTSAPSSEGYTWVNTDKEDSEAFEISCDIEDFNAGGTGMALYTVGGSVTGLSGTVILLNNGEDGLTLTANEEFTFDTALLNGSTYNVTVGTQPETQTCFVTNGSGTISGVNVTNVSVTCETSSTSLSASISSLVLATSGNARQITITNTGSSPTANLSIAYPTWPSGTTANSTCTGTLGAAESCTITITPGSSASSNCGVDFETPPTPGAITVSADNASADVEAEVLILTYNCIWQKGYLFSIDDTTPATTSIAGTVAALEDNSSEIQWYNGSFSATGATDTIDGQENTTMIVNFQGEGSYAALLCDSYGIDSEGNAPCSTGTCYNDWYLPAICQIGNGGCDSDVESFKNNLPLLYDIGCSGPSCFGSNYWSSTEYSTTPNFHAWAQYFFSGDSGEFINNKSIGYGVRCVREVTP